MSKMCTTRQTLKLVTSKERSDVINLFFACFYKFRKAESCFNKFSVDWSKIVLAA